MIDTICRGHVIDAMCRGYVIDAICRGHVIDAICRGHMQRPPSYTYLPTGLLTLTLTPNPNPNASHLCLSIADNLHTCSGQAHFAATGSQTQARSQGWGEIRVTARVRGGH